jgi:hypothetical protein
LTTTPRPIDQRTAAQIRASLSNQVIAAGIAGVVVEAALVTFVFQYREFSWPFAIVAVIVAILFGGSIVSGMQFVGKLSEAGYKGEWSRDEVADHYLAQATLWVVACVLVVVSAVLAGRAPARAPARQSTVIFDLSPAEGARVPTAFLWFDRTWGRDDLEQFQQQAIERHGLTRPELRELYRTHPIVRRVLGVAGPSLHGAGAAARSGARPP